jgi:Na+-transporting methylmalonyl-CoA/oxaloacetate decarboxylase gamma subunit
MRFDMYWLQERFLDFLTVVGVGMVAVFVVIACVVIWSEHERRY